MTLEKNFDFNKFEDQIYQRWLENKCFNPIESDKQYSIVMPPPNATGILHLGHSIGLTIQDIMVRFKRMQGYETLYIPGTDHAAIATQSKVEGIIFKETGQTRHDVGRENLLKEIDKFVKQSQETIIKQTMKMGTSCSWDHLKFTLDKNISDAVLQTFTNLYKDDLIYRKGRITNWDPNMQTTVSDDELEYVDETTDFYYFQFGPVVIGTARPETKFKDEVIVVHPQDERYKHLIGETFEVDWIEGKITAKVIADDCIDMELGTGAMTITPAHSQIDFELAEKHNLKIEKIINLEGKILEEVSTTCGGLTIKEARKKVVKILDEKGLLVKTDHKYKHSVPVNYRGGGIIEPQVLDQWYLDVNKPNVDFDGEKLSFKQIMLKVVEDGRIAINPSRFNKIYFHWINNLRDWCLSRQIWYGHRIPAWYKGDEIKVQKDSPGSGWKQDPDTLDTWFSSGLWTFTTLGYPEPNELLEKFHPTSLLETGHDILFFWVARMILLTTYATKQIPFKDVYLHGMVTDKKGKKMSKSKGNGIDPLEVIEKYGADALRLSLVIGSTAGEKTKLYEEKIASYRNFVTKVWNSARFASMNLDDFDVNNINLENLTKKEADKWIIKKLHKLIQNSTENLEKMKISDCGSQIYEFLWNDFCSWYLEISKTNLNLDTLVYTLKNVLILLHPYMPFATSQIWEELGIKGELMLESWPEFNKEFAELNTEKIDDLCATINGIRSLKSEFSLQTNNKVEININTNGAEIYEVNQKAIQKIAGCILNINQTTDKKFINKVVNSQTQINLILDQDFDIEKEIQKSQKNASKLEGQIKGIQARLSNEKYVANAPKELVNESKSQLEELNKQHNLLLDKIKNLQNSL